MSTPLCPRQKPQRHLLQRWLLLLAGSALYWQQQTLLLTEKSHPKRWVACCYLLVLMRGRKRHLLRHWHPLQSLDQGGLQTAR